MYEIGKKIKAVLVESKMSIQEFADKLHVARPTIYNIFDRNDISIDQLLRISKILKHDFIADVYGYEKEEEAKSEPPKFQLGNKWYTKSELKKAIEEHDRQVLKDYRQRIDAFLASKKREPYYKVEILTEYSGPKVKETNMSLSDEDKQRASNFLAKPNCEENENDTLFSIIDWNKYYEDCGFGELRDVTHVDFTPRYSYLFTAVVIESPEATPSIHPFYIEMTDKQYSQLLLHLIQQSLTVQMLEQIDPELYRLINRGVYLPSGLVPQSPYVIFMTEAEKDANEILGDDNGVDGVPVSGFIRALLS